jgi:hypothetical protein
MWEHSLRGHCTVQIEVICLVLELCEGSAWFLQLQGVSRVWRRAVERVSCL